LNHDVNSMSASFAKKLKEEREKYAKLTVRQMAELLGIPIETYRNYESVGVRHREPDLDMLLKIARVLEVSIDYLLGNEKNLHTF